jgi:hypothetical protein
MNLRRTQAPLRELLNARKKKAFLRLLLKVLSGVHLRPTTPFPVPRSRGQGDLLAHIADQAMAIYLCFSREAVHVTGEIPGILRSANAMVAHV